MVNWKSVINLGSSAFNLDTSEFLQYAICMKILRLLFILILFGSIQPVAFGSAGPTGESCSSYLKVENYGGYKYVCIKAPKSMSNPFGKKLIWSKAIPIVKTPSTTNNSNSGYWTTSCITTEVANPNYDGRVTDSRGHIQWPTIKTQQCSKIWVKK